jgi:hypothetical protein
MVRDAPKMALLTMRVQNFAAKQDLILRSALRGEVHAGNACHGARLEG